MEFGGLIEAQLQQISYHLVQVEEIPSPTFGFDHKIVAAYAMQIDERCERFFALRQPKASDLRFIKMVFHITDELSRAASANKKLIKLLRKSTPQKDQYLLVLSAALVLARKILNDSLNALARQNDSDLSQLYELHQALEVECHLAEQTILQRLIDHPVELQYQISILKTLHALHKIGRRSIDIMQSFVYFKTGERLLPLLVSDSTSK